MRSRKDRTEGWGLRAEGKGGRWREWGLPATSARIGARSSNSSMAAVADTQPPPRRSAPAKITQSLEHQQNKFTRPPPGATAHSRSPKSTHRNRNAVVELIVTWMSPGWRARRVGGRQRGDVKSSQVSSLDVCLFVLPNPQPIRCRTDTGLTETTRRTNGQTESDREGTRERVRSRERTCADDDHDDHPPFAEPHAEHSGGRRERPRLGWLGRKPPAWKHFYGLFETDFPFT